MRGGVAFKKQFSPVGEQGQVEGLGNEIEID
jgi:hypothetical protein